MGYDGGKSGDVMTEGKMSENNPKNNIQVRKSQSMNWGLVHTEQIASLFQGTYIHKQPLTVTPIGYFHKFCQLI